VPTGPQRGGTGENPPDEHTKTPCQLEPEQLARCKPIKVNGRPVIG